MGITQKPEKKNLSEESAEEQKETFLTRLLVFKKLQHSGYLPSDGFFYFVQSVLSEVLSFGVMSFSSAF